ncbi:nuclear transport factor 2 family protein [Sodalinema gerasimenkoae]|uniref:nuclear transport factor 2 family protein n=1 Tax=Sodalinema gerasimenkoae TaxID=2862348 RepID=UPI001FE5AF5A|nr:nuclear transport factor 2 family protein [Sodalinema gerasimenkoae]
MTLNFPTSNPQRHFPRLLSSLILGAIASGLTSSLLPPPSYANQDAPEDLQELLQSIDKTATEGDIEALMRFYSDSFRHYDGLSRENFQASLEQLWERFPNLNYDSEILSWDETANGYEVETETTIVGLQARDLPNTELRATVRSRQTYENGQIVSQEILQEEIRILSGDNPPNVRVNLPLETSPNSRYHFDLIVEEPLGEDLILGAAMQEPVSSHSHLNPNVLELEPLNAGGLFKVGEVDNGEGDYWVSGAIVRRGGIAIVSRRMRVN